jgi:hypothetical protein
VTQGLEHFQEILFILEMAFVIGIIPYANEFNVLIRCIIDLIIRRLLSESQKRVQARVSLLNSVILELGVEQILLLLQTPLHEVVVVLAAQMWR